MPAKVPFAAPHWPASEKPQMWALKKIIPYDKNSRTHPQKQVELLADLMKRHGVDQPIVVDEDGIILKGHGRRLAAIAAGFEEFPVVIHRGLSKPDKAAMRIQDNQVGLLSGWDNELIRAEIIELKNSGFELDMLGFDGATLQWMSNGELVLDPDGEWGGMPEFNQPDATAFRSIIVHFKDQASVDLFAKTIKQIVSDKAKFLWFPVIEIKPFVKYDGDGSVRENKKRAAK
jgi:hypothetical protein